MNLPIYYSCIAVNQPLGTFYICPIPASEILPIVSIERRGISVEEHNNVQRALDPKRQKEIAKYVEEPDATFPTSVTLSADSEFVHIIESSHNTLFLVIGTELESRKTDTTDTFLFNRVIGDILEFAEGANIRRFQAIPENQSVALVIDGQHRVEGLRSAGGEIKGSHAGEFEIPLVFMFDLTPEIMARIFVTINSNQRKVDSSLISDLFGLSSRRSPMRTSHIIASSLNSELDGPFTNGLKMLGKRKKTELPTTEFLSQGSFCKYLQQLISSNPADDERKLRRNERLLRDKKFPFRDYFIDERDDVILRITKNFFTAAQKTYSEAWDKYPKNYLIRKTVGFLSLIKFLMKILPTAIEIGQASESAFLNVFEAVEVQFPESEWEAGKFSSSEADAAKVANKLYAIVETDLKELLMKERASGPSKLNNDKFQSSS